MSRIIIIGLAAASLASSALSAQKVERVVLDAPDASLSEPFSSVSGLRELSDGRLIVSDRLEKAIRFVDFAADLVEQIGHVGQGPGEYTTPGALLPLPHDSTLLVDFGNMRMTVLGPDGVLGRSFPMMRDNMFLNPTTTDSKGRLFAGGLGLRSVPGQPDSSFIERWDLNRGTTDTVASLPLPQVGGVRTMRSSGAHFSIGGLKPFAPRDAWTAAPDGRIALVFAADYHVEWVGPDGHRTVGPAIEYRPVPLTNPDKEAWADRLSSGTAVMIVRGGGQGSGSGSRTLNLPRPEVDEQEWPKVKPPFQGSPRTTPEGGLWVQLYVKHGDPQTYDVFDSMGNRVKQVVLPQGRRLVGFGDGVLYAVNVDSDDLQWLERYRR